MRSVIRFFCVLFILSSFLPAQVKDLIKKVNLTSGKTDSVLIGDMFYAEEYNIKPVKNEEIKINFNGSNKYLYFTPDSTAEGFYIVGINVNGEEVNFPVYVKKPFYYSFKFIPKKKYKELTVFGEFNGWNRHKDYFTDEDGDGIFTAKIEIEPGKYQYKFYADGEEIVDPFNPDSVNNGMGAFNSVITIPEPDKDFSFLHNLSFKSENGISQFSYYYERQNRAHSLSREEIIALIDNKKIDDSKIQIEGNEIKISFPANELSGFHFIRLAVSSEGNSTNIQLTPIENGRPLNGKSGFTWYDGIIYSLMIDRFANGDKSNDNPLVHDSLSVKANYNGGDLAGIINKIEEGYFDSLGINILWISPVYDNPNHPFREYPAPHRWFSGYHGYWPVSSTRVDEHFGSLDLLTELIKKAHKHNIKVLLDFVSNHVHKEHPYFNEHRDWFGKLELPDGRLNLRLWDEQRLTTWFEPYLPSFDYINSNEALDTMTDNAIWWLKTTGADGFRHDAVKHVPNVFWRVLSRKLKKEFPQKEVYQIGETFGNYELVSSYVNNGQLSAQFNFNLYDVAQAAFIDTNVSMIELDKELKKTVYVYGPLHLMGNIMDSHDKNRFIAYADGDLELWQWNATEEGWNNPPKVDHPMSYRKAELYYAYMFSIPGLPVIYYGSEFGMSGASDPDNRRPMRFGDQLNKNEKKMLRDVQRIVKLRKEHSALRYGDLLTLKADKNSFAFMRSDMNERIVTVINNSDKPKKITIKLPSFMDVVKLVDLLGGRTYYPERNSVSIILDEYGYGYFKIVE